MFYHWNREVDLGPVPNKKRVCNRSSGDVPQWGCIGSSYQWALLRPGISLVSNLYLWSLKEFTTILLIWIIYLWSSWAHLSHHPPQAMKWWSQWPGQLAPLLKIEKSQCIDVWFVYSMLKVASLLKRRKIGYEFENSLFPESGFYSYLFFDIDLNMI